MSTTTRLTARAIGPRETAYERRWRLPPPFLRGAEPIEGAAILEEIPGPVGVLVWQSMRDAMLWANTPVERREGLFVSSAERRRVAEILTVGSGARLIEEPLRALAAMLSHAPDAAPEVVTLACQRISQWAEDRGALATALAFAQAAALASPASARHALRVGRLARQRGEYPRAEGWLQRAIVLARQERDGVTHAWGYTALGVLHYLRGNFPGSRRCHLRALRIAERHSLRERAAAALHDLTVVAVETGSLDEALHHARRAFEFYGPRHAKLPALANDLAVLWMNRGEFAKAYAVLRAVWPHSEPNRQVLALAGAARAAAACGDRQGYDEFRRRALAADRSHSENVSSAYLALAKGAVSLREWDAAEELARHALEIGRKLHEGKTRMQAEALLQEIAGARNVERRPSPAASPTDSDPDTLLDRLLDSIAEYHPLEV